MTAPSALDRECTITYNSYAVGGSSASRQIHGYPVLEFGRDRASLSFDVLIVADSEANFASYCAALETAFRTPYKDLTVALGSSTLISVTQSGNTGLDAIASVTLPGGPPDSGRARRYRCRIEWGLPASWASTSGLRDAAVTMAKTPSDVAEVTIKGTFTAVGSNDALAQYQAQIDTYASSIMSALGISTYELEQEREVRLSVNKKTCDFVRVYRQLIYPQAGSTDDSAIVRQSFAVTRTRRGSTYAGQNLVAMTSGNGNYGPTPGDTVTAVAFMDVAVRYDCWVDKDVTTDLATKWRSIESWVLSQVKTLIGASQFGVLSVGPSYDLDQNRITAEVTAVATNPDESSAIVQNTLEARVEIKPGWRFEPLWDGDPESALAFETFRETIRTTTQRQRRLGSQQNAAAFQQPPISGNGWYQLSWAVSEPVPLMIGLGANVAVFTEVSATLVEQRVKAA